jgi:hypothetical protein
LLTKWSFFSKILFFFEKRGKVGHAISTNRKPRRKTMNKPQGKQQPAAPSKAPEQKKQQAPAPQPQKPKAPGK